jgi:hypothetical protein
MIWSGGGGANLGAGTNRDGGSRGAAGRRRDGQKARASDEARPMSRLASESSMLQWSAVGPDELYLGRRRKGGGGRSPSPGGGGVRRMLGSTT